jgi:predicted peptidase
LLIFIPGGGQYGNGASDLPLLLNDGVAKLINNKSFPAAFSVDGQVFSFIVLTPQLKSLPSVADIQAFLVYAKSKYRVDASRIYVGGLSVGGQVSGDLAAAHPDEIAAILPISGESQEQASATAIANNKIPVWDFHNSGDPTVNIAVSDKFIAWINAANPAIPPKRTVFQSNQHDAWTKALDPTYKEFGMNVYEWLLQYSK